MPGGSERATEDNQDYEELLYTDEEYAELEAAFENDENEDYEELLYTLMRNTLRLRQLLKSRTFTDECLFRFQCFLSNRPSCPSKPSWPTTIEQRDAHRLTALSLSHLSTLHCQLTFNKTIKGRPVLAIFTSIRMEHCTVLKLLHRRVLLRKMRQDYRYQPFSFLIVWNGVKTDQPFIVNSFVCHYLCNL